MSSNIPIEELIRALSESLTKRDFGKPALECWIQNLILKLKCVD